MFCKKCGKPLGVEDKFCSYCGTPVTDDVPNDIFPPYRPPMNWYKLLIYFSLFAGAALSLFGAVSSIVLILSDLGAYLANMPLFVLEIAYAASNIVVALSAIYTRNALAKYKKKGPLCLYIYYGIMGASEMVYYAYSYVSGELNQMAAELSIVDPMTLLWMNIAVTVLTTVAVIAANYIYFTKRKDLFLN